MYARDHAIIATPIGAIRVEGDVESVLRIDLGVDAAVRIGSLHTVREAAVQLLAYFSGDLQDFDLPLVDTGSLRGRALRSGLIAVGYGLTTSYGELARQLGSGARAIGQLCARNPYPIVVPCHRVVGAGGALGAYSAGDGPTTKQWLIEHERRHLQGE